MLKIKDNVSLSILRKYGFKTGLEYANDKEKYFENQREYLYNDWFKFLMDPYEDNKIKYTEYDLPLITISINSDTRIISIDIEPFSYRLNYIGNDKLNIITDTLYQLTIDGIVEIKKEG